MAPVTRRSPVWRRAVVVQTAVRPRWRDSQPFATGPSRANSRDQEHSMAKARKPKSIRKSKRNQGGHTSELGPGAGTSLQLLYLGFDSPGELAEEPWH